jgi:hypothetical protein
VVEAAEASLGNSERCGKIFCRPQIAFLRENLVRRVVRPSLEFSGPILECRRRAPTSEGCRRWCLVPPDAEPDSREFPAREMGAKGSASTHWGRSSTCSNRRTYRNFRCCVRTRSVRLRSLPRAPTSFNSSSENVLAREISLRTRERESVLDSRTPVRTILSCYPGKYSLLIRGNPVRAGEDNFVHPAALVWHSGQSSWQEELDGVLTLRARR